MRNPKILNMPNKKLANIKIDSSTTLRYRKVNRMRHFLMLRISIGLFFCRLYKVREMINDKFVDTFHLKSLKH